MTHTIRDRSEGPWGEFTLYASSARFGRPSVAVTRKRPEEIINSGPVLLLINPLQVWRRIQPKLESSS
jgi:hypothetical protein